MTAQPRPPWDPDPRYVAPVEPVRRLPEPSSIDRSGVVIVWLAVVLSLEAIAVIVLFLVILAARPETSEVFAPTHLGSVSSASLVSGAPRNAPEVGGVAPLATPVGPSGVPQTATSSVRGWATWYPGSRGWHGIAHVALPGAHYRTPKQGPSEWVTVTVFRDGRSVSGVFPVVDACGCGDRHGDPTVVDLSILALRELGLYDVRYRDGIWRAEVQHGDPGPELTLPPTDVVP